MKLTTLFLLSCFVPFLVAHGQLAITEGMSSPAAIGPNGREIPMSDYWELTNFGALPIDLTGYRWNDSTGGLSGADSTPFDGLVIQPGESILFVQSGAVVTQQDVRLWWGAGLAASTRIVLYVGNGLGQAGDAIRLWAPDETDPKHVVAEVFFQDARSGVSFTYDTTTGDFGALSQMGDPGVVRAATRDDVGSPGRTAGPVPLSIRTQPADILACPGDKAVFEVVAWAVPVPTYQWYSDAGLIAGETRSQLTVTDVSESKLGQYWVEVRSGALVLLSRKCRLSMDITPHPPVFKQALSSLGGIVGETTVLQAEVCGYPEPRLQWFRDGVPIEGQTHRTLVLESLSLEQSGSRYCVESRNDFGEASECIDLVVQAVPKIAITEVRPAQTLGCTAGADWFEVTNFDTREVSLLGYRWISLNGLPPILEDSIRVNSDIRLRPGESAIFVERLTPLDFKDWWGAERLPPDLQIDTFKSQGLSQFGDTIYMWGPGATDPNNPVTTASWAGADPGISREFVGVGPGALDVASVAGVSGAFEAANCGDIGSPGFISNPALRILTLRKDGEEWVLRWKSVKGQSYVVQGASTLAGAPWRRLKEVLALDWVVETRLSLAEATQYLRLEMP